MGASSSFDPESGKTSSDVPTCEIQVGAERRSLEVLRAWSVGSTVWADRAWTYTRLGSFTTTAFRFKVRSEVDRRKATFRIAAPKTYGITVYVLGETKAVDAPWAFSAGAPELSEEWSEVCETLPEYEAGATYRFDFGRCLTLEASQCISFDAFSGGKVDIFVKMVANSAAQDWQTDVAEAFVDLPSLRTAPGGRRPGRCEDHEALSLPPEEGWEVSESGWETNTQCSSTWMRRRAENGSNLFLCVPLKSRWATLPGKGFVPVDSCLSLLNCMRDLETTWRQCFQSWKEHSRTVNAWRKRLQLLDPEEEVSESVSEHFPLPKAFRRKSSLKRSDSEGTPKKVSFAATSDP